MSIEWTPAVLEAAGDWDLWLLTGVVVVCWGLVVAATATLFGSASGGLLSRAARRCRQTAASINGKAAHNRSTPRGLGNA